jgi:hypothetical protein
MNDAVALAERIKLYVHLVSSNPSFHLSQKDFELIIEALLFYSTHYPQE